MSVYSIDQFFEDFPDFKPKKNIEQVLVQANYDWDMDYKYDPMTHGKILKCNAVPWSYSANGYKFNTIEELLMHIELTYGNDAEIYVDAGEYSDDILKMWYSHQMTATSSLSGSSASTSSPSNNI